MRGTRCAAFLSWTTFRVTDLILNAFDFAAETRRTARPVDTERGSREKAKYFFRRALELVSPLLIALTAFAASAAVPSTMDVSSVVHKTPFVAEEIKVRVQSVDSSFSVSGVGLRFLESPDTKTELYQALRVTWTRDPSGLFVWTIKDRDSDALISQFKSKRLEIIGTRVRINLKPVNGKVTVLPKGPRADIIAILNLEEYLRGVLPAEMPKDWPLEALKAQAVASRTFALYRKRAREKAGAVFHVESTVMDQVYRTFDFEAGPEFENVFQAVRETEGMILVTPGENPVPLAAYFHADCGGHTEDARAVWGEAGVGTAVCPHASPSEWKTEFSLSEIESRVKASLKNLPPSVSLMGLEALGKTVSGRVENVRLVWSDGEETLMPAHAFRMSLGHDRVRSTNFRLTVSAENRIHIIGQGAGHGVGLCQHGARHMAQNGKSFREILKHYYPNSRLLEPSRPSQLTLLGSSF